MIPRFLPTSRSRAFGLLELMIAVSVVALSVGGLFAMFSATAGLAESQRQTAAATLCLSSRLEQIRASNWTQITSASALRQYVLNSASPASSALPGLEEQITVSEYPPPSGTVIPICVQRLADGTTTTVSEASGGSLMSKLVVRVDVRATWRGTGSRSRLRETSTVVALGGIAK